MDMRNICRDCHKEWIVDYKGMSMGRNYECPDCEKKRLHKKWLNKKKKLTRSGKTKVSA